MDRIVAWLCEEAEAERGRRARASTPDGTAVDRLRGELREARAQMLREALHCVRVLARAEPADVVRLAPFLAEPADELVAEVLEAFATWRTQEVLPDLLALYRRLEHARARRPLVARALNRCLRALTGRSFDSAPELARWLDERRRAA